MTKKKNDETVTPMEYLHRRTVAGSVPFNWKLFQLFVDKGYKAKRSQEAVLFLGYLVSWQSIITKTNKLRKGYFYRAQPDVTRQTGLTKQSQQKAMELLQGVGLINVKPYQGQANHFQVNIDEVLKVLDRAQKEYTTRTKNGQEPGPEVTTNNINSNEHNNEQGKGIAFQETKMQPISFFDYRKQYIKQDTYETEVIEHFLNKHVQVVGPGKHNNLKPGTWNNIVETIMTVDDQGKEFIIDIEDLESMINHYFEKARRGKYKPGCDFSIIHFNDPGIKEVNYYESVMVVSPYANDEE